MSDISFHGIQNRSIFRLTLFSIVLVSLLPVGIIAPYLYKTAWDQQYQQLIEKHQLLAQNLAEPLQMYINTHQQSLKILASTINQLPYQELDQLQPLIEKSVQYLDGFNAITLLSADGKLEAISVHENIQQQAKTPDYSNHPLFARVIENQASDISDVHPSFITGEPGIVMSQAVLDKDGEIRAILFAELDLHPLETIRSKVRFGIKGHSAMVDSKGHVLAHPNPDWVKEIRDISDWPIVQKMMRGETGVTEFYSSFMKADMVAGYTGIKSLGWGIMVPQPKSEIEAAVNSMLFKVLLWSIFGFAIAILAAILLTRWITGPINILASNAGRLASKVDIPSSNFALGKVPDKSPLEVRQLWNALSGLVARLAESHIEIANLNSTLLKKVERATAELRVSNERLQQISSHDYLTEIGNRRYFETALSDNLSKNPNDDIGIMLLDVDNFKQINDKFGHAAGDYVLTRVAEELHKSTREGDIIARYGGDEFVAQFKCDEDTLLRRAENLRLSIEKTVFIWNGNKIKVTLSIGILSQKNKEDISIDELMSAADHAMYRSKKSGRNKVSKYH